MRILPGAHRRQNRYAQVKTSVTLVYSEHDWSRPAEREQVARLLGARTVTVSGVGHFSALERPAEMVSIIRHGRCTQLAEQPTWPISQLVVGGGWGWKGVYHHQSARSPRGPGHGGTWGGV